LLSLQQWTHLKIQVEKKYPSSAIKPIKKRRKLNDNEDQQNVSSIYHLFMLNSLKLTEQK
jgi:hypothetical protein